MRKQFKVCLSLALCIAAFVACNQNPKTDKDGANSASNNQYSGYESQVKWGEHIVTISGCNDCHTPKKMTAQGPMLDSSLLLSGHPAQMPPPDIDRKMVESKGLGVTQTLTSWVGPWGISYAANLTPDSTGIGLWKEEQFIYCLRNGKFKGLADSRPLLPPMPWVQYKFMSDDEMKAVFAYLKSLKPVHNLVPNAASPVMAARQP